MFIGWQPHEELLKILGQASAVLIPSFTEAGPLLVLEAYAHGVPLIAHDLPEISDYIKPEGRALAESGRRPSFIA